VERKKGDARKTISVDPSVYSRKRPAGGKGKRHSGGRLARARGERGERAVHRVSKRENKPLTLAFSDAERGKKRDAFLPTSPKKKRRGAAVDTRLGQSFHRGTAAKGLQWAAVLGVKGPRYALSLVSRKERAGPRPALVPGGRKEGELGRPSLSGPRKNIMRRGLLRPRSWPRK